MTIKKVKKNLIITIPLKQLSKLLEVETSPEPQNEPVADELAEEVVLPNSDEIMNVDPSIPSSIPSDIPNTSELQKKLQGEINESEETNNTTGTSI
jgi:hypothetical protein